MDIVWKLNVVIYIILYLPLPTHTFRKDESYSQSCMKRKLRDINLDPQIKGIGTIIPVYGVVELKQRYKYLVWEMKEQ